jgi:hypothetical protein
MTIGVVPVVLVAMVWAIAWACQASNISMSAKRSLCIHSYV